MLISCSLLSQAILRKVQDSAMMLKRDADMKKRILEAKQKYEQSFETVLQCSGYLDLFIYMFSNSYE